MLLLSLLLSFVIFDFVRKSVSIARRHACGRTVKMAGADGPGPGRPKRETGAAITLLFVCLLFLCCHNKG